MPRQTLGGQPEAVPFFWRKYQRRFLSGGLGYSRGEGQTSRLGLDRHAATRHNHQFAATRHSKSFRARSPTEPRVAIGGKKTTGDLRRREGPGGRGRRARPGSNDRDAPRERGPGPGSPAEGHPTADDDGGGAPSRVPAATRRRAPGGHRRARVAAPPTLIGRSRAVRCGSRSLRPDATKPPPHGGPAERPRASPARKRNSCREAIAAAPRSRPPRQWW